jgi:hypothetical protein
MQMPWNCHLGSSHALGVEGGRHVLWDPPPPPKAGGEWKAKSPRSCSTKRLTMFQVGQTGTHKCHGCKCQIGPSMLASDLANLASEANKVVDAGKIYLSPSPQG